MRRHVLSAVAWLTATAAVLPAQQPDSIKRVDSTRSTSLVIGADTLILGGRTIAKDQRARGPVVVAGGDLVVAGTVEGDAIAIIGDVVVPPGGHVTGNAVAVIGEVRRQGQIDGTAQALSSVSANFDSDARKVTSPTHRSTTDALRLSFGWLIVMLLIGLGVLVFAAPYLDGVVDVLEQSFWRSLGVGLVGMLGLIPALVLLIVVLTISIIGILLIPFAAVAYLIAAAGLVTLGFLAVARVTGTSVGSAASRRLSARGSTLRSLLLGIAVYLGLWVVASALSWAPIPAAVVRTIAFALTSVAATAGFGAALLSRAGTQRDVAGAAPAAAPEPVGWQTPTPVTGVSAARRPLASTGRPSGSR